VATFLLEFVWKVNDGEGVKWAFFDADAASYAERLHHYWLVVLKSNGFYSASYWWAKPIAYPATTFGFASILI